MCCHTHFYLAGGDLNAGPYTYIGSTLLSERDLSLGLFLTCSKKAQYSLMSYCFGFLMENSERIVNVLE